MTNPSLQRKQPDLLSGDNFRNYGGFLKYRRPSFYNSYLSSYLERDVRQILNVTSLRDFERFIRVLAPRSGQLLNKTEVARDVGVSVKAVNDWLSVLQASNQIVLLEPWFRNISKRLVKTPKLYFCDTGLLSFLLGVSKDNFQSSPFKGQLWETLVFAELRKLNNVINEPVKFWFYRDQLAREIDFIIEKGGFLSFAECKWNENPGKSDVKNISSVSAELDRKDITYKNGKHYVISLCRNKYSLDEHISVVNLDSVSSMLG